MKRAVSQTWSPQLERKETVGAQLTWLPGIVFGWGVGLVTLAILTQARISSLVPVAYLVAALVAVGVVLGYGTAAAPPFKLFFISPLFAATALIATPDGLEVTLWYLFFVEICFQGPALLAVGVAYLLPIRYRGIAIANFGLTAAPLVVTFVPGGWALFVGYAIWALAVMVVALFLPMGWVFYRLQFPRPGRTEEIMPVAWWPRRFSLRQMFGWTTWFAVIFAALGAARLSAEHGWRGSLAITVSCVAAVLALQAIARWERSGAKSK